MGEEVENFERDTDNFFNEMEIPQLKNTVSEII